jgi:hypothetical protein
VKYTIEVAHGAAYISPCSLYRYWLKREWFSTRIALPFGRAILWVGLNPSTADAFTDDNTIRRMMGISDAWGYRKMYVCNVFAWRSTDPRKLMTLDYDTKCGPDNYTTLCDVRQRCDLVVGAWGASPYVTAADERRVFDAVGGSGMFCVGHTKSGAPRHPLYLPNNVSPAAWAPYR